MGIKFGIKTGKNWGKICFKNGEKFGLKWGKFGVKMERIWGLKMAKNWDKFWVKNGEIWVKNGEKWDKRKGGVACLEGAWLVGSGWGLRGGVANRGGGASL